MTWLAIVEIVWVVGLCVWIILERRSPVATLAWILVLAWLPLLGIAVYLLIGPRRLHRKRRRYRKARARFSEVSQAMRAACGPPTGLCSGNETWLQVMGLVERAGEAPPLRARQVELFSNGDACFAALEQKIAGARHHVHLEYYIWEPDETGTRLRDLLCRRAADGVHVRLLVDAIGSSRLTRRFLKPLRESGVEVARFNPVSLARFRPGLINFRTHRKIVICDGTSGFIGGINICDDHSAQVKGPDAWRDTHLLVEGPPVAWLQLVFLEDWHFATGNAPYSPEYFPPAEAPCDGPWVQIVASGPDQDFYAIHKLYFAAIAGARHRVWLTTPYFVPDEAVLSALVTAALRGTEVKILVPKRGDSWLVTAAARSYFDELVQSGVRVFEYQPAMLHAKTMVVDQDIAVVGTANLDNRSFRLNFEVVAAIYDSQVAARLAELFEGDLLRSKEYSLRQAKRASMLKRLGEATARLLSPIL